MSTHYYRFTRLDAVNRDRAPPPRTPLLERLLARAGEPNEITDWRADALRLVAPTAAIPGIAAAALFAEQGSSEGASVFIAAPIRYVAEMSSVRMPADGILHLPRSEADALAADFNRVWDGAGVRLLAGRFTDLYCVLDFQAANRGRHTIPKMFVVGRSTPICRPGAAHRGLRRLMSEMEMWLFEHAVNRIRSARSVPAVSGLWLWGGGAPATSLPVIAAWSMGDDPLFKALGAGRDAAASGVAVVASDPGTAEWRDLESHGLQRSFADLHSGRIDRLALSAGHRCFSVRGRWNWRPWRRHRPWWESFG